MSFSIYDLAKYSASATYNKHDIIIFTDGRAYYARGAVSAGNPPVYPSVLTNSDVNWTGFKKHPITQKEYSYFNWRPSYQSQANFEPKVQAIKFGDGYEGRQLK